MSPTSLLNRKRGGIFKSAVGLLVFASAAGTLGWMLILPSGLRAELEARTGFPVTAETLSCNPLGFTVEGTGIRIGTPSSFGAGGDMMEIKYLVANASLPALMRGEVWINELELHISKMTLVVDERGKNSLETFARRLFAAKEGSGEMPFFAESVHLVVDEVTFVDNSRPMPVKSAPLRALLDVTSHDVKDPGKLFDRVTELGRTMGAIPPGS